MVSRDLRTLIIVTVSVLFVPALLAAGCGGSTPQTAEELSGEEVWARTRQAQESLRSWHMEVASYYENTAYGSGQIQTMIIDVNGDRMREQDLMLGQVYSDTVRIGDRYFAKDLKSGSWKEMEVAAEEAATGSEAGGYTSRFLELPSLAEEQQDLGTEVIDERQAKHLHFRLSPASVAEMFSDRSAFDLTNNEGGEVDVWIDGEDFFILRYVLVIRGVVIPEQIGRGDVRFVVSFRDFNQDIEITME